MADDNVNAALADAAAAQAAESAAVADAAAAVEQESIADASAAAVAAAQTAAALATEHAAIAEADAAAVITQNQGELEWLRQHATSQESFNQSQAAEMQALHSRSLKMEESLNGIANLLSQLTQGASTEVPQVTPEKASENADAADRKEPQSPRKAKGKRVWI